MTRVTCQTCGDVEVATPNITVYRFRPAYSYSFRCPTCGDLRVKECNTTSALLLGTYGAKNIEVTADHLVPIS